MKYRNIMPITGIDNVSDDEEMAQTGETSFTYLKEAINVDITKAGKVDVIASGELHTSTKFREVWQSPLHKDVFGRVGDVWVKINNNLKDYEPLAVIGDGPLYHTILNNTVCCAGDRGIFVFNGSTATPLTIDRPTPPIVVSDQTDNSLTRSVAISWCRDEKESALSDLVVVNGVSGVLSLPTPIGDRQIDHTRVYATSAGGSDLQLVATIPASQTTYELDEKAIGGMSAPFKHLSPMPTGKYLSLWRGRLVVARANIIRFSEPLAYHLHDERFGFVQMPERVTFLMPVNDGIWVGQVTGVIFLLGKSLDSFEMVVKSGQAPIEGSAIMTVDSDLIGEATNGGDVVALWMSSNGYVAGTSTGDLFEYQAGRIKGVSGKTGTTVRLDRRLITCIN